MGKVANRVRKHSLAKPGAIEDDPWGHSVAKVGGKMFVSLGEESITVKSSLERQSVLIQDPAITVAKYVGRFGWVTIELNDETVEMALSLVDDSYDDIFNALPKKERDKIAP